MSDKTNSRVNSKISSELYQTPGHLVRRLHQINLGIFHEMLKDYKVTPVQFGLLLRLTEVDRIDHRTLSTQVGVHAATISDVIFRLEKRGLITRTSSTKDRRVKLLSITAAGKEFVKMTKPHVNEMQDVLLGPLDKEERKEFIRLTTKVIEKNNNFSRVPIEKRI